MADQAGICHFTDMKRNGDWEYALGVNLMNQHLTYFTLAGARKYDYPPTFDYHEPWWNDYKYINDSLCKAFPGSIIRKTDK